MIRKQYITEEEKQKIRAEQILRAQEIWNVESWLGLPEDKPENFDVEQEIREAEWRAEKEKINASTTLLLSLPSEQEVMQEQEEKKYKLKEKQSHQKGNFLLFSGETDFHTWNKINEVWDFDLEQYVEKEVKRRRNKELAQTDYLMLSDVFALLTMEEKASLLLYRKELRDITLKITDEASALNLNWPTNFILAKKEKRWYNSFWTGLSKILFLRLGGRKKSL